MSRQGIVYAYLDNAASTRISPEVAESMQLLGCFANPSSLHSPGVEAKQILGESRGALATLLGASSDEVIFTSGATEANNMAILGLARAAPPGARHLITSALEHSTVLGPIRFLQENGYEITTLGCDSTGRVDPAALEDAMRPDTALVTVMLANNEVGTVEPIPDLARITRSRGVPFHCDAAQASGKWPVHVDELGVDLLTLSAHKIHGPRGIGALYQRAGTMLVPLFFGGGHEKALRPGTENVTGAVGLARALSLAERHREQNCARMESQRQRLRSAIEAQVPEAHFHGSQEHRLPSILSVSFPGLDGDALVLALDAEGVACSSGSACESRSIEPSHVLRAMGIPSVLARGTIRLSIAADTQPDEIDHAAAAIPRVIRRFLSA